MLTMEEVYTLIWSCVDDGGSLYMDMVMCRCWRKSKHWHGHVLTMEEVYTMAWSCVDDGGSLYIQWHGHVLTMEEVYTMALSCVNDGGSLYNGMVMC